MKHYPIPRIISAVKASAATFAILLLASVLASGQSQFVSWSSNPSAVGQIAPDLRSTIRTARISCSPVSVAIGFCSSFIEDIGDRTAWPKLREFARHSDDLAKLDVRLAPISVDDQQHAGEVWEKAANKKFTILSDPDASVIGKYGLLHERGAEDGEDIALRTTILIGPDGRERWRRVSKSVPHIPSWKETFRQVKAA